VSEPGDSRAERGEVSVRECSWAYLLSAVVGLAMVSPVLRSPPVDSFPLSTYPMYSHPLSSTSRIDTLLGVDAQGARHLLSPTLIAGDPWPILAVEVMGKARRGAGPARRRLCAGAAERVAAAPGQGEIVSLEFVTEVYDSRAYFGRGETEPSSRQVLARCEVERP